ncbi:12044_t:CDS:2, partial [Ambispora gerdemannii]
AKKYTKLMTGRLNDISDIVGILQKKTESFNYPTNQKFFKMEFHVTEKPEFDKTPQWLSNSLLSNCSLEDLQNLVKFTSNETTINDMKNLRKDQILTYPESLQPQQDKKIFINTSTITPLKTAPIIWRQVMNGNTLEDSAYATNNSQIDNINYNKECEAPLIFEEFGDQIFCGKSEDTTTTLF